MRCSPRRRRVEARVHLEVDVRPAARVARREDARERHRPVGVGLLHAAQVVLVGGGVGVQRVVAVAVAVPQVHGGAGERRAAAAVSVTVSSIVSGTPSATVVELPKLARMSLRTTPLSVSTLTPLEPSPGNGPAVSSGIGAQLAPCRGRAAVAVAVVRSCRRPCPASRCRAVGVLARVAAAELHAATSVATPAPANSDEQPAPGEQRDMSNCSPRSWSSS